LIKGELSLHRVHSSRRFRLLYPERVIANWPRNGRPKYYPALILGHDLPSPIVQGEERTQNSLLVKYHVQWPRGFDPRNSKPFLYRKDFYISSEPGFFNNEVSYSFQSRRWKRNVGQLEPWGTKYDYAPADIVEQVKDHLDTLQTMVKGEYGPGKERHEDFLAASEMRRNEVDKHGNMATGDYSDLHIAAVTVFLQSWCTKFPVEGCEVGPPRNLVKADLECSNARLAAQHSSSSTRRRRISMRQPSSCPSPWSF
jgi:hypothetical protein